jgi:hypothetical protein
MEEGEGEGGGGGEERGEAITEAGLGGERSGQKQKATTVDGRESESERGGEGRREGPPKSSFFWFFLRWCSQAATPGWVPALGT